MRLKHLLEVTEPSVKVEIYDLKTETILGKIEEIPSMSIETTKIAKCLLNCHVRRMDIIHTDGQITLIVYVSFEFERFLQDLDIDKIIRDDLRLDYKRLDSNMGLLYLDTTCDFVFTKEEIKQEICKDSEFVKHVMSNLKYFEVNFSLE